ncbi:ABC transporter ATP-binding protein/permease [Pseudomonas sp. CT11-2]|jgi:putative ATP-binding cassette transporter|uniref:ABC transporter ATP-binding protein/permease n=1 Tax=unclassified Pseudomonas TaxID=196821 RepID=UPI00215F1E88|nr:ABC transporter ATP-binding protein/permease [Pseudomonas sp. B21-019]UVM34829.1 ABC transporter ATP-binding protein/permease [Pseudomonas sp. B21-019]
MFIHDMKLLAAPYWSAEGRRRAWLTLTMAMLAVAGIIAIQVRWNEWSLGFYNSLQSLDAAAFGYHVVELLVLDVAFIACTMAKFQVQQRLLINWREKLTQAFLAKWLDSQRYYRSRFHSVTYDNPDQRIAEDCKIFVEQTLDLGLNLLQAIILVVLFCLIMWRISGTLEFEVAGHAVAIPGYMLWLALIYAVIGSGIAHWIGKPLIGLNFLQQRREADFRFGLTRLREDAENVALSRGHGWESKQLLGQLGLLLSNYAKLVRSKKHLLGINAAYERFAFTLPLLLVSPRFFSREIQLGQLTQIASAFGEIQASLSFLIRSYPQIAEWRATKTRLCSFWRELEALPAPVDPVTGRTAGLRLHDFAPLNEHGLPLFEPLTLILAPGERLLLRGPSGVGKTTLLRSLAGLWPRHQGSAELDREGLLILPQRPYLPSGSLHELLHRTGEASAVDIDETRLEEVLKLAELQHLPLHSTDDWSRRLSPGEQQRMAMARALLIQPPLLFLDEATSGLDDIAERRLYKALAATDITVVSIGHRESLGGYHTRVVDVVPAASPSLPKPIPSTTLEF